MRGDSMTEEVVHQLTRDEETESSKVQYKEIGNTKFKLVSYYSGTETYMDIVKGVLRREFEKA